MVLLSMITGCIHASVPSPDEMRRQTAGLETIMPTLEALRVKGFRDQDWCRFIDYPRGGFSNILDAPTCNLFDGPPQPFDQTATADWERVRKAVSDGGVQIRDVLGVTYDEAGQLQGATFDVVAGAYDRFMYFYDKAGTLTMEPNPDTIVLERVNDQWWFTSEDWN